MSLTLRFYVAYEHQHTSLLQPVSCNPSNPEHHTRIRINMFPYANLHKYAIDLELVVGVYYTVFLV